MLCKCKFFCCELDSPITMVHEDAGLFSVLHASAPATLNQLAAPIATALQRAMFGRFLPTESVRHVACCRRPCLSARSV